ncbi:MAG: hypothetical protein ACRDWH_02615 [Acidimicrobiia bacterium]
MAVWSGARIPHTTNSPDLSPVRRWLAPVLVLGLLVNGCGDSSTVADGTETTTSDGPQIGSEEFGMTMERLTLGIEEVESLIGECMRDAGFEYVPVDFVTVRRAMLADKSAPGLTDDEYREQFGYGISTQFDKPAVELGLGEQNARILDALPESDQVAYLRTLYGENEDATFAISLEAEDFSETGGCTRAAVEEVFDEEQLSATYVNPGDVLIEQDPRVIAALEDWSQCVGEEGFDYSHPDEIEEDIQERFDAITEGQDPQSLAGSALDALTELQGEERAVAQIDFECAEELLEPVIEEVESEIYGAPQG